MPNELADKSIDDFKFQQDGTTSPDLTEPDYFLSKYSKSKVYSLINENLLNNFSSITTQNITYYNCKTSKSDHKWRENARFAYIASVGGYFIDIYIVFN